ncbi:hypothetical protein EJ04DRAFT_485744 [Polyplosphaeria fusca]|uniref:Uncharacterized protein n=1 Tax=Polyplosphaeria fusca TaxID=682080 RepID=A0A9P4R652_9PLEO|nr:hypothetical protein EJ04DRAFT_485744 [Polyplosphaeria fusca]
MIKCHAAPDITPNAASDFRNTTHPPRAEAKSVELPDENSSQTVNMPAPVIMSSFMSIKPLEPVLVFASAEDAASFQSSYRQGRIMPNHPISWVFLPMPEGLLRLRTAKNGDIAYDFDTYRHAVDFNDSIGRLGKTFQPTREKPDWDHIVYLGKQIR